MSYGMRKQCCGFLVVGLLALLGGTSPAVAADGEFEGVSVINYRGWANSILLEAEDPGFRAVVVPAIGGRILGYGNYHHNILYQRSDNDGQTLATHGKLQAGGYFSDLGPELRGIPAHPLLTVGEYNAELTRDFGVTVVSAADPTTGIRLTRNIILDPESGDLAITQIMRNTSAGELSYCHWDRTKVQGGGFALIPLKKGSKYEDGWAVKRGTGAEATYVDKDLKIREIEEHKDTLIVKCINGPMKVGVDSDAGWIAYAWRHFLFIKYFPIYEDAYYSDNGNTVELYWNDDFAELEPLSPEVFLRPGDGYQFPGLWKIIELRKEVKTHRDARKLINDIPKSPFK